MNRWLLAPRLHRALGRTAPRLSARLALREFLHPSRDAARTGELPDDPEPLCLGDGQRAWRWGDTGPIALLQHGWEGHPRQFACLLAPLRAAGMQVVALAAPGHAGSAARPGYVLGFAQSLVQAARELGGVEAVLGHSLGGAAALIAMRYRLAARRVATLAAPSSLSDAVARFAHGAGLGLQAHRHLREALRGRIGMPLDWIDTASIVRGLHFPALIVHDQDDRHVPHRDAVRIAAALPQARLLSSRGLRHGGGLRDPRVVAELAGFLAGQAQAVDATPSTAGRQALAS